MIYFCTCIRDQTCRMQDPIECVIICNMPGQGRESIHLIGIIKVVVIIVTSDIRVDGIEEHQQVTHMVC